MSEEESGELRKIAEDAWLGEYLRSEREEQERRKVEGKVNGDKYTPGDRHVIEAVCEFGEVLAGPGTDLRYPPWWRRRSGGRSIAA